MHVFLAITLISVPMKGRPPKKKNHSYFFRAFSHSCPSSSGGFSESFSQKQQWAVVGSISGWTWQRCCLETRQEVCVRWQPQGFWNLGKLSDGWIGDDRWLSMLFYWAVYSSRLFLLYCGNLSYLNSLEVTRYFGVLRIWFYTNKK